MEFKSCKITHSKTAQWIMEDVRGNGKRSPTNRRNNPTRQAWTTRYRGMRIGGDRTREKSNIWIDKLNTLLLQ